MPHLKLDVSSNVLAHTEVQPVLQQLVDELSRQETIDSASVKAYVREHSVWAMGEGGRSGFIHLEVAILDGRPFDLKQRIAQGMRGVLESAFATALTDGTAGLTIEVRDMDRAAYVKL